MVGDMQDGEPVVFNGAGVLRPVASSELCPSRRDDTETESVKAGVSAARHGASIA